jgi:UDPglucose 6-dehydrogenase
MDKLKLGIIGYGFVGQAIEYAFMTPEVDTYIIDPKYNSNTLKELCEWEPDVTFICLPTPSANDGSIDATLVQNTVQELVDNCKTYIFVKSTVTPDIVDKMSENQPNVLYVPEFLSEGNAKMDMINSSHMVVGTHYPELAEFVQLVYDTFSMCNPAELVVTKPSEAAFVKYTINTFLAMKTAYFNQIFELCQDYGVSYQSVMRGVTADSRIGYSHTKVPGTDGKKGFGGACFPKDLDAFIHFADNQTKTKLHILKSVRTTNNRLRSQYETDDREKANNIKFK